MANKNTPPRKVKVEVRPASNILKIILILLILFSIVALVALRWVHNGIRAETQELTDEAATIEYENSKLNDKIANQGSVQNVQDIAQEELGLVDPDTIVVDPE